MPIAHATSRSPPANVNDVEIGSQVAIECGATLRLRAGHKGYYHFEWWKKINESGAFFVTRDQLL